MEPVEEMYSESTEEPSLAELLESDAKPDEGVTISPACKFNADDYNESTHDLYLTRRDEPDYFIKILGCNYDKRDDISYPVRVVYNDVRRKDDNTTFGSDIFTVDGRLFFDRPYYGNQPNLIIKVPKGYVPVTEENIVTFKPASVEIKYEPVAELMNVFINVYRSKIKGTDSSIIYAGRPNLSYESASKNAIKCVSEQSPLILSTTITTKVVEHIATINIADHPAVKAVLIEKGILIPV
jgi:hypothetical protein